MDAAWSRGGVCASLGPDSLAAPHFAHSTPPRPLPRAPPPARLRKGSDKPHGLAPAWNKVTGTWMAPFVMEIVNSRIIHRSAALAATPYGSDFKCERAGGGAGRCNPQGAVWRTAVQQGAPPLPCLPPLYPCPRPRPQLHAPPPSPPCADREAVSSKSLPIAALTAGLTAVGGAVMAFGPTRSFATR